MLLKSLRRAGIWYRHVVMPLHVADRATESRCLCPQTPPRRREGRVRPAPRITLKIPHTVHFTASSIRVQCWPAGHPHTRSDDEYIADLVIGTRACSMVLMCVYLNRFQTPNVGCCELYGPRNLTYINRRHVGVGCS